MWILTNIFLSIVILKKNRFWEKNQTEETTFVE